MVSEAELLLLFVDEFLSEPLTHTGGPVIIGLKTLVASPPGTALIAAVGVGADGAFRGAHRGELGTFIFI